jgi:hypothetical protein
VLAWHSDPLMEYEGPLTQDTGETWELELNGCDIDGDHQLEGEVRCEADSPVRPGHTVRILAQWGCARWRLPGGLSFLR